MARLPQPGGDNGNWGSILNDYLSTSHKSDGTIKDNAVTAASLAPNSVTNAALASDSVNASTIADGSITDALLSSPIRASLSKADTALQNADLAAKADDAAVVHLAGNESVTGPKDFTGGITVNGATVVVGTDTRLTDSRVPVDNSVTSAKLQDSAVTEAKLSSAVQTKLNTVVDGSVTSTKIANDTVARQQLTPALRQDIDNKMSGDVRFEIDPDGTTVLVIESPDPITPGKVTGVVTTAGNKSATVSWQQLADGTFNSYVLRERSVGSGTWIEHPNSVSPITLTFDTNGLRELQVRGDYSGVAGEWSDIQNVAVGTASGVVFSDTFTRTAAELVGTSPTFGPGAYTGTTGQFSVDGSQLIAMGGSGGLVYMPLGATGDVSITGEARLSTQETSTKTSRIYAKFIDGANALYLSIGETASGGNSCSIVKRIGNTNTTVIGFPANTLPLNTPTAMYPFSLSINGTSVSATINTTTVNGTITSGDAAILAPSYQTGITANSINHGFDNLSISVNGQYV